MQKGNIINRLYRAHFDPSLDLRVQAFHLLAFGGMATGIVTMIASHFTNAGILSFLLSLIATVVAVLLLLLAWRKKSYRLCFLLSVIAVFILLFPGFFFAAGGYKSGMPSFFVYSIVFTALMLEGARRNILIICEFVVYIACCLIAYHFPQTVLHYEAELDYMADVIVGFTVTGVILLVVVVLYIRIYENRQKQLEELHSLKIEFLSNMSHELKMPLTGVFGFASHTYSMVTEDWPLSEKGLDETRDNLRLIIEQAGKMKRIIDELLTVARIEHGNFILQKSVFSLPEVVGEVVRAHFKAIDTNGNTPVIDILPDFPHIYADRERLIEVLMNLLSNASRHTKDGEIKISAREEHRYIALSVSDDGEGIPKELQENIFKRFLGADIGRAHGTGLGLYICKQIIEAHGGEIRINSKPGMGTAVCFTLPGEEVGTHDLRK